MKNKILFLMIIGVLFSCNNNDDNDTENELVGNWKLIQMTGSIPNSETSGAEMDWQETYVLNANGTFLKSRDRDGVTTEVSGTYNFINNSNEPLIELNFDTESEIIGSCTSNMKETMNLQSETIFLSFWEACDGPGLKYEKIN
jgi:hypothetical protein